MRIFIVLFLIAISNSSLAATPSLSTTIYRCVDSKGIPHFTETPTPQYYECKAIVKPENYLCVGGHGSKTILGADPILADFSNLKFHVSQKGNAWDINMLGSGTLIESCKSLKACFNPPYFSPVFIMRNTASFTAILQWKEKNEDESILVFNGLCTPLDI